MAIGFRPLPLADSGAATQTLTPSLFVDGDTFYAPTVLATYTLTPALFADGDTFYSPTVTPGAVTLTPSLFVDGDTFYSATVTATATLSPALFVDADTFYAATVAAGTVTLTPALFADPDTFYSATVTADGTPQTLTPDLFVDADTFYTPVVSTASEIVNPIVITSGTGRGGGKRHGNLYSPYRLKKEPDKPEPVALVAKAIEKPVTAKPIGTEVTLARLTDPIGARQKAADLLMSQAIEAAAKQRQIEFEDDEEAIALLLLS